MPQTLPHLDGTSGLSEQDRETVSLAVSTGVVDKTALSRAVAIVIRIRSGRVTVQEASELLGVDDRTVFRLVQDGAIRTTKRGKRKGQFLLLDDVMRHACK